MQKSPQMFFDEMQLNITKIDDQSVRYVYMAYQDWLKDIPLKQLESKRQEAELLFRRVGITFNVYGEADGAERLIPFDVIPRIISSHEWTTLSAGAIQRVRALNMFTMIKRLLRQALCQLAYWPIANIGLKCLG